MGQGRRQNCIHRARWAGREVESTHHAPRLQTPLVGTWEKDPSQALPASQIQSSGKGVWEQGKPGRPKDDAKEVRESGL